MQEAEEVGGQDGLVTDNHYSNRIQQSDLRSSGDRHEADRQEIYNKADPCYAYLQHIV